MSERSPWRLYLAQLDQSADTRWNLSHKDDARCTQVIWVIVTHSGDGLLTLVLMGLIYIIGTPTWRTVILTMLAADVLTTVVVRIIKVTVKRPRPEGKWGAFYRRTDPHSFPSGHAGRAGALGAVGLMFSPFWLSVPIFLWGILVTISRIILGVHFASDVIVGYGVGLIVGLLTATLTIIFI